MIPIIAIANLINGLIAATIAVLLFIRYRRRIKEGRPIKGISYFILFYASVAIMWLLYATPGLITPNLYTIMVLQSFADIFVYMSAIIGILISFTALNKKDTGSIIAIIMGTATLIYALGRIFNAKPHIQEVIPPYVYWHPDSSLWLLVLTGLVASASSLTFIITFIVLGYRAKNNYLIYRRSLYLSAGMSCMFLASLIFFVMATGGFVLTMAASIFGIIGLILMLQGIHTDTEATHEIHADLEAERTKNL